MWTTLILGLVDFVLMIKYGKVDDQDIACCRHVYPGSGFAAMLKYKNVKSPNALAVTDVGKKAYGVVSVDGGHGTLNYARICKVCGGNGTILHDGGFEKCINDNCESHTAGTG